MSKSDDKGFTRRSHLEKVWEQTGSKPEELDVPPIPVEGIYLYNAFWDLLTSEGISWESIYYYQKVYDVEFDGEELKTLQILAREATSWQNKMNRPKPKAKTPKVKKR